MATTEIKTELHLPWHELTLQMGAQISVYFNRDRDSATYIVEAETCLVSTTYGVARLEQLAAVERNRFQTEVHSEWLHFPVVCYQLDVNIKRICYE